MAPLGYLVSAVSTLTLGRKGPELAARVWATHCGE